MRSRDRIDQRIIALYDDYTHCHLDRRLFLEQATALVGAGAAAAFFAALRSNYALAEQVKANDPRLTTEHISYPGSSGPVKAYAAEPNDNGSRLMSLSVGKSKNALPGVLVIHQNRGLNPHIEDVTRRVALAGYVAIAPDFMSQIGGTPADDDQALNDFSKLELPVAIADGLKSVAYVRSRYDVTPKIGIVGFCWGGSMVNLLAVSAPDLMAGVAYYGMAPPLDKVPDIKAQLMLHYAGLDDRVNATRGPYEAALTKAGISYEAYTYEGANHGFNDDTGARYDAAAATLAWRRTLDFFARTLKA